MFHLKYGAIPALAVSCLLLTGCVDVAYNNERPINQRTSEPSVQGTTSLRLWMFDTSAYLKPAAEEVAKEMNIKLHYEFINPEVYKTRIKVAVSANELPDIFGQYGGQSERELILNAKVAAPLNDVLQSHGLASTYLIGQLIEDPTGNIYSVPYRPEQSQVVLYNKKLLAQLGLKPPATWEELLQIIRTARHRGMIPIALGGKDRWPGDIIYNTLVLREDVDAYKQAQSGLLSFTDRPFVDAANKVIQLVKEQAFQPGFLDQSDLEARELFYKGQALMIINGSWVFTKAVPSLGDELGYVPFPSTGAVKDPFLANTGERSNNPYGLYVNAESKQLQAAKEFAVRYSLKVNDELVKLGQPSFAVSHMKAEGKINEAYAQYLNDFHKYHFIQTYWFNTLPAAVGEEYRDLNQKLFTGTLSAQQFTQTMEQVMRRK